MPFTCFTGPCQPRLFWSSFDGAARLALSVSKSCNVNGGWDGGQVDLKESMKDAEPLLITPDPLQWPINSLTWTVDTREIVAATGSHIQMFRLLGL